jgi:2'-5' RNA ligase
MKNDPANNRNIRAFIAISLPGNIISHLENLQADIKSYNIKASWPNPSNMHLTLKFLGDIPLSNVKSISDCINSAVLDFKKENENLRLSAEGIGIFPSVKKPRILWAGIQSKDKDQTDKLKMIHSLLQTRLEKTGFKKEKNQFSSHITLCRIKKPVSEKLITKILKQHADIKSDAFPVNSITLFQSQLKPSGAAHTKLFSKKI